MNSALVKLLRPAKGSKKYEDRDGWDGGTKDCRLLWPPHCLDRDDDEGCGGEEEDRLVLLLDEGRRPEARDRQYLECGGGARHPGSSHDNL